MKHKDTPEDDGGPGKMTGPKDFVELAEDGDPPGGKLTGQYPGQVLAEKWYKYKSFVSHFISFDMDRDQAVGKVTACKVLQQSFATDRVDSTFHCNSWFKAADLNLDNRLSLSEYMELVLELAA